MSWVLYMTFPVMIFITDVDEVRVYMTDEVKTVRVNIVFKSEAACRAELKNLMSGVDLTNPASVRWVCLPDKRESRRESQPLVTVPTEPCVRGGDRFDVFNRRPSVPEDCKKTVSWYTTR